MRFSLLEEREDVVDVLCKTLEHFCKVNFVEGDKKQAYQDLITYYGNKYLNYFASFNCDRKNFQVIKKEYSNAKNILKKTGLLIYVFMLTSRIIYRFIYNYRIRPFIPNNDRTRSWLILGGNTRIRIIEANKNQTIVILKNGYPHKFISNEIFLRSNLRNSLIPRLLEVGETFFIEELCLGTPINRVEEYSDLRRKAYLLFYEQISRKYSIKSETYGRELIDEINHNLSKYNQSTSRALAIRDDFLSINCHHITQIHGDLQGSNILLTENGLKVIDWESTEWGSLWYDYIVLFAGWREGKQISELLELVCREEFWKMFEELNKHFVLPGFQDRIRLFLLEELRYQLRYRILYTKANRLSSSDSRIRTIIDAIQLVKGT